MWLVLVYEGLAACYQDGQPDAGRGKGGSPGQAAHVTMEPQRLVVVGRSHHKAQLGDLGPVVHGSPPAFPSPTWRPATFCPARRLPRHLFRTAPSLSSARRWVSRRLAGTPVLLHLWARPGLGNGWALSGLGGGAPRLAGGL